MTSPIMHTMFGPEILFADYPFSTRTYNILRRQLGDNATLGDVKDAIERGELSDLRVRGLGCGTMRELVRATGAVVPPKMHKSWRFCPYTGKPINNRQPLTTNETTNLHS
jgi:hypothetical protein